MEGEATLVIIKHDGLKKSLAGDILSRLSQAELKIIAAKVVAVSEDLARKHYEHLQDKPFFEELIQYITGKLHGENRVLALIYYGDNAIKKVREVVGATNPEDANPVSVRGAYGRILTSGMFENVVHASSSNEDAEKEIKLWFRPDEIVYGLYPAKKIEQENCQVDVWA